MILLVRLNDLAKLFEWKVNLGVTYSCLLAECMLGL